MVTEMDAGECEAAVAAIVGLVGTPAMVDWSPYCRSGCRTGWMLF